MNKKYTIKDIAKLAGVSKGTVDRVLHKRGKVSPLALEKVNEVLNVINYEPNLIARNLKNNKIYHICILLPDPKIDPYWLPCIQGIKEAEAEFKAYNILVETFYFDPEQTTSFTTTNETIIDKAPDAVLLAPLFHKETLDAIKKYDSLKIIVNTFNNQVESTSIKNFVGQDLFRSGRVAAKLLNSILDKGQIAIIHIDETYKNAIHMQEKERGFRNFFTETDQLAYQIATLNLKSQNIEFNLTQFINENPELSAIFITTSKAYQIAKTISTIEHKKIRIIGYDLIDENVNHLNLGVIDFLIHQNQKRQVYLGLTYLVDHFLFHKETPAVTLLPIDIINSENANLYRE
jgi:LacI family transcriptional regulator